MFSQINIKQIIINPRNYRFGPVGNEQEEIDLMLHEKGKEILKLAEDIAEYGLDPAQVVRVIKQDSKKYLALDGNRRLTAIKCLNNQNLISDIRIREKFSSLARKYKNIPQEVTCFVFSTEHDAARWIRLIHTGKNDGIGQDSWGTAEQNRFDAAHGKRKLTIGVQLYDVYKSNVENPLSEKAVKITTVDRILSNATARKHLGIDVIDGNISTSISVPKIKKFFELTSVTKVGEVYTSQQQIDFAKNLDITPLPEVKRKNIKPTEALPENSRLTPRTRDSVEVLFGEKLQLKTCLSNNLYRDICDLSDFYFADKYKKQKLSETFPGLIRMSLRLLVESAATGPNSNSLVDYVKKHFSDAKSMLTQEQKTMLSAYSITDKKLIELLQHGAHKYASSNDEKLIHAMSLIIGKMLILSHGSKTK